MNIQTADNISQLEEFVRSTRKKAKFKIFNTEEEFKFLGVKFGGKENASGGFVNYHDQILYQEEILDIKTPTLIGKKFILEKRPKIEKKFNDEFIISESIRDKVKRENNILTRIEKLKLDKLGLASFKSRQYLQNDFSKPLEDVLITKYESDFMNSKNFFENSDSDFLKEYLGLVSSKIRLLHDSGIIWGDAKIGNTGSTGQYTHIFDFEFKTNPNMLFRQRRIKDLISFTLNTMGNEKLFDYDVVKIIFESYGAKDFKNEILLEKKANKIFDLRREKLYSKPIHGIKSSIEKKAYLVMEDILNR
ncbi:MAG: hypothetical protein ACMXX9_01350 [Candidatus Woesearchaeota archaeon]